ncbi:hypothetical protein OS493_040053 [Desmophyllum pertusum]|uniref:Uncharacterized protein n=1 Tax=Desmophyllum pertusum TaxID=174260 RepID=A0A9W9ZKD4_9CNID|nr:hypothetical protein OS493_040053 [Desmophyllum pertusum]
MFNRRYLLSVFKVLRPTVIQQAVYCGVQLASYLLQACPDEQEAAACCSESSARLGGSHSSEHNPAFHPAGIVGSGALRNHISKPNLKSATNRTRSGLIASQKAVHAHPDHVTSWAVLSASVTAHNIATGREGLGTEKNGLGARISQFCGVCSFTRESQVPI